MSRAGFFRQARLLMMRNGLPVTNEIASDVRRICSPPSPCEPSIGDIRANPSHSLDLVNIYHNERRSGKIMAWCEGIA